LWNFLKIQDIGGRRALRIEIEIGGCWTGGGLPGNPGTRGVRRVRAFLGRGRDAGCRYGHARKDPRGGKWWCGEVEFAGALLRGS